MSINQMKINLQNQLNKDLLRNPNLEWWLSWPVIVISTIIFWPVGVFLIWKRISIDKKTALLSGEIVLIVGCASIVFAVLALLVSIEKGIDRDDVMGVTFFFTAGIALVFLGKNTKKNAKKFKKYMSIITNRKITSIDNISVSIPVSYDVCKKDLQKMIDKGYFEGAYIDESEREIILPKYNNNGINESTVNNIEENVELTVVVCKGCGAKNTVVKGSAGECEFCGSPIS